VTTGQITKANYLIRSTVLGTVLTKLDASGNQDITYVPANGLAFPMQTKDSNGNPIVSEVRRDVTGLQEDGKAVDPFGAVIQNVQPPTSGPPPNIPFFGATYGGVSWNSFTNANNLATGCSLDGVRTNCSKVFGAVSTGMVGNLLLSTTGLESSFANIGIFMTKSPVPSSTSTTPPTLRQFTRNPQPGNQNPFGIGANEIQYLTRISFNLTPFDEIDSEDPNTFNEAGISKVADAILSEPDCIKFAETILNQLSKGKGGSLMDTLNQFFDQPKKHDLFTRNPPPWSRGEASAWGNIKDSTAAVFLRRGDQQIFLDANNLVQELFHLAGSGYSDEQLARALKKTSYAADAIKVFPDGSANIFDPNYFPGSGRGKWSKADGYSTYFHAIANLHCGFRPLNQYRNKR
ncbi:MAG TPA: hypothetical protein VFS76_05675, partial [Pyrinomonadaceae bacterium]|nr:hypothetical protein [Pyrinomonadaceae bacterium]